MRSLFSRVKDTILVAAGTVECVCINSKEEVAFILVFIDLKLFV